MKTATSKDALLVVLVLCAACAPERSFDLTREGPPTERSELSGWQTHGPLPADSDLSAGPRGNIYFADGWQQHQSAIIYADSELSISVDPSRFPRCGTGGSVSAQLRLQDGSLIEVALTEGAPGSERHGALFLPAHATQLELWLRSERDDGCLEWDSDFGRNYHFEVHPWAPTRVRFGDDWSESIEGELVAGGVLVVDYDWDRLPDCRVIYRGFPGWEIIAHPRFDAGTPVPAQSVTRPGGQGDPNVHPVLAVFPIPLQARRVELWFENTQYPPTCQAWDSDFGRNYQFEIAAP